MQTHSIQVPNLFASARAEAAIRNRKRKRLDAEQATVTTIPVDDPSSWTIQTMESEVQDTLAGGIKKHLSTENLAAVKIHLLELYVHKVPPQEEARVNLAEVFDCFHFIVGTFERALSTLEKYLPSDFPSQHLYGYIIGALRKNVLYYEEALNGTIEGEEEEADAAAAANNDNHNNDDDHDNENSNLSFDSNKDDNDTHCRHLPSPLSPIQDEDKFQRHYVRIFDLAKKYGVH